MKTIRSIVGWFLMIFAGLWAISGLLCAVFTLLGQMEGLSGWGARLGYTAAFLFLTAVSLSVVWLGRKIRPVKSEAKPVPPVRRESATGRGEEVSPVTVSKPAAPVPVKKARTPLPTWVTGPGLCHDRFPFRAYGEWKEELDECRGGPVCYVYNGDEPLREAIRELVKKEGSKYRTIHVRLPSAGALEWLGDSHYAQKWEPADAVPVMDLGCNEKLYALCREHGVRIVTYAGENGLYDHVNGCHLRIHTETGYGSVDDAATVGMWWVEELKE